MKYARIIIRKQETNFHQLEEKMMNFEILAQSYAWAILITIIVAIIYLVATIINHGGTQKYYHDRGYEGNFINVAWSVLMIVVLTWLFTPVATVLCNKAWLCDDDDRH